MANSEYSVFNDIPVNFGSNPSFYNHLANGMVGLNKYYQYQAGNAANRVARDLAPYQFSAQASGLLNQTSLNNASNIINERRQQALQREDSYGSNLNSVINLWLSNNKDRNVTISYMVNYYNLDEEEANEMLNRAINRYNQLGRGNNTSTSVSSNTVPSSNITNISPQNDWGTLNNQRENTLGGQLSQMAISAINNPYLQDQLPDYLRSTPAPVSINPSNLIDINTQAQQQPPLYQFSQDAAGRMIV
nr:MAG TPA: hypothetical protein [Caudoviricetes sp.]